MRPFLIACALVLLAARQEDPPDQPHTDDPSKCVRYCYPHGYEGSRPKGTPEGIPGYECQGEHCAKAVEEGGDNPCDEHGGVKCTSYCSRVCCQCLAVCM